MVGFSLVFLLTMGINDANIVTPPLYQGKTSLETYIRNITVRVIAAELMGSGTLFTVKAGKQRINFVLTTYSLIEHLKKIDVVKNEEGDQRIVITYEDVCVTQGYVMGKKQEIVGITTYTAKVVHVNPSYNIALLQVKKPDAFQIGAVLYPDETLPEDTKLFHCGVPGAINVGRSLLPITEGKVEDTYMKNSNVVIRTSCMTFNGNLGGPVLLGNGMFIGMLIDITDDAKAEILPSYEIKRWANEIGLNWLFDPTAKVTMKQIREIPFMPKEMELLLRGESYAGAPQTGL